MFGILPATGFFFRHARNIELSNVEIATEAPDARPAIWAEDVDGLDVFRLRARSSSTAFALQNVREFRTFGSRDLPDRKERAVSSLQL